MRIGWDNAHGMTLEELRTWLDRCQETEIPGQTQPKVRVSLTGKIKRIEVSD
jgi:hypothetical protein